MLISISLSIFISLALTIVYSITNYKLMPYSEKKSPFECGFDPLSSMRIPFSTRFFLLVVLFLVFDVEIALIFPMLSILSTGTSWETLFAFLTFLLILLMGMLHEWNEGALDWVSN